MCDFYFDEISIHALREEGDLLWEHWENMFGISIHALREEGDSKIQKMPIVLKLISIHALREEGDRLLIFVIPHNGFYFYPRPPRGGRLACTLPRFKK